MLIGVRKQKCESLKTPIRWADLVAMVDGVDVVENPTHPLWNKYTERVEPTVIKEESLGPCRPLRPEPDWAVFREGKWPKSLDGMACLVAQEW